MNSHSNFRLLLIHLLLIGTCFVVGITSAPIETEIEKDSGREAENVKEEEIPSESKAVENVETADSRALGIPFMPNMPNPISGSGDSTSGTFPGIPGISALTHGSKLYLGTFGVLEMPLDNFTNLPGLLSSFGTMGNLGNIGNLANMAKPPSIPGLSNIIPGSGA